MADNNLQGLSNFNIEELKRNIILIFAALLLIPGALYEIVLIASDTIPRIGALITTSLHLILCFVVIYLAYKRKNINALGLIITLAVPFIFIFTVSFLGMPDHYSYLGSHLMLSLYFLSTALLIFFSDNRVFVVLFLAVFYGAVISISIITMNNPFDFPVLELYQDPVLEQDLVLFTALAAIFSVVGLQIYSISVRRKDLRNLQSTNENLQERNLMLADAQAELLSKDSLIYREKMVALGSLVAGIGHEINTPLGVITGSVENSQDIIDYIVDDMLMALRNIPSEVEEELMGILETSINYINSDQILSTSEERKYRRIIQDELKTYGIDNARSLARHLVRIGIFTDLERYEDVFLHARSAEFLELVEKLSNMFLNTKNIETAVDKMQKITFALQNYTHQSKAERMAKCNIIRGIETVLVLYHNQLKKGIEVIREFDEDLEIMGFADQLDQVWTNLVQNAIHAMNYQGTLEIKAFKAADHAIIRFIDSGIGIPKDIQERIFDPFFTTKKHGEGSGLGLDICVKIIKKHNGTITVDSNTGRTCFEIKIPL